MEQFHEGGRRCRLQTGQNLARTRRLFRFPCLFVDGFESLLDQTQITDAGVAKLKEALPDCEIIR